MVEEPSFAGWWIADEICFVGMIREFVVSFLGRAEN
jgi:hypothetical protein